MSRPTIRFVTILIALSALGGCLSVQRQLENVAKDWCMTIRASQVIPVYPLTEDLQPGDVFLVTVPIQKQVKIYRSRGFLPLDLMVTRLHDLDYAGYYQNEYWSGDFAATPHARLVRGVKQGRGALVLFNDSADSTSATVEVTDTTVDLTIVGGGHAAGGTKKLNLADPANDTLAELTTAINSIPGWTAKLVGKPGVDSGLLAQLVATDVKGDGKKTALQYFEKNQEPIDLSRGLGAPRAAFPTYTFTVKKGSGARVAIPVQGVPIALGFMKTSNAVGSVTISDAYTYAAPTEGLIAKLRLWAGESRTRHMLAELAKNNPKNTLYLRVVQRVYMTGGVVVSVTNENASAFGADADLSVLGAAAPAPAAPTAPAAPAAPPADGSPGDAKPAQFGIATGTKLEDVNTALSAALSDKSPGASLRILQASSRSVSMKENFDRPLVIGYLGFDFPILEDGRLGVPVATLNQLDALRAPQSTPLRGNQQSVEEAKIVCILESYSALSSSSDDADVEKAKAFVIQVAKRIDDAGVQAIGTRVESGEIPASSSVAALRVAVNKYLATKESEGAGGIHEQVVAVLYETAVGRE